MTFFDCTAALVGQLTGNGQKGMLQIDAPPVVNFWLRHCQKGKTNLDLTEARGSEWQWHQLGICKSAPRSRQITTPAPHHSVFYRPDALPAAQQTASKQAAKTTSEIRPRHPLYDKLVLSRRPPTSAGWRKKVGPQTHSHNSVKSEPIL